MEILILVDLTKAYIFYGRFILDILGILDTVRNNPITSKTNNNGLYNSIHSATQVLDKRLTLEIGILQKNAAIKGNFK